MRLDSDLYEPRTNAEQSETGGDFRVSYESERWLPVVGYEGRYEVSDLGRVRSLISRPPRLLALLANEDGYWRVGLWDGERQANVKVHRLVALAPCSQPNNYRSNPMYYGAYRATRASHRATLRVSRPFGECHG